MVCALLLGCLLVISLFALALASVAGVSAGSGLREEHPPLQEVLVKNNRSDNKIAVVTVEGVITSLALDGTGYSLVDHIKRQLERAGNDGSVKAVLLKVDSPGGEVLASDEIYHAIRDFQDEHDKPVVAVMSSVAASGGYYVAAPCRWIVAHELTITGSIGVIMQGYNFRGLMDKVGVKPLVFKSGEFKDMMSSTKPLEEVTPEEKAMMQKLIDEAFTRFKRVIADGRSHADKQNKDDGRDLAQNWTDYADGRILTGKQAYEHGFVDELGDFDIAVKRTLKLAGIPDANLVRYQRLFTLGNLFRLLGQQEGRRVQIDLGLDVPKLPAGRLYFLPAYFFH